MKNGPNKPNQKSKENTEEEHILEVETLVGRSIWSNSPNATNFNETKISTEHIMLICSFSASPLRSYTHPSILYIILRLILCPFDDDSQTNYDSFFPTTSLLYSTTQLFPSSQPASSAQTHITSKV